MLYCLCLLFVGLEGFAHHKGILPVGIVLRLLLVNLKGELVLVQRNCTFVGSSNMQRGVFGPEDVRHGMERLHEKLLCQPQSSVWPFYGYRGEMARDMGSVVLVSSIKQR